MFNTLTQHRWPFNSAVQGDKRCRYAAERHRAKTLATSSVTSKVNPGRQYQAAATRVLTSGQSSFDSVKPGIQDTQIFGALHWARVFGMAWIRVGFMPGCLGQLCAGIHLLLVVLPVG